MPIHTHLHPDSIGFSCRHGNRGSAALTHWTIPPPIMHISNSSFVSSYSMLNYELEMTSCGSKLKIYLRSVTPQTHTWWPWPPPSSSEELRVFRSSRCFIYSCVCCFLHFPPDPSKSHSRRVWKIHCRRNNMKFAEYQGLLKKNGLQSINLSV